MLATGPPPGVTVQFLPERPNATFDRRMRDTHTRSVSPRPRRVVSPSHYVAQIRVRAAEQKVDSALSSTGRIVDQTIRAQVVADDA